MKTTLDLPEDVDRLLRIESARRGGRRAASMSRLVADAVRAVYGPTRSEAVDVDLTPGRVVVRDAGRGRITSSAVRDALEDTAQAALRDRPKPVAVRR